MNQTCQIHPNMIVSSPLPGRIMKILVHEGDVVKKGQDVVIVESMKMFHTLQARENGRIGDIPFKEGDAVQPSHHVTHIF